METAYYNVSIDGNLSDYVQLERAECNGKLLNAT